MQRSDIKQKFTGKSTIGNGNYQKEQPGSIATDSPQDVDSASTVDGGEIQGDDNINVVVRVRPMNKNEQEKKDMNTVQFPGDGVLWIDNNGSTKPFTFNVLFEPEATQKDVFQHSGVKKLVSMAVDGYACTCFAFGQTGSGKTHSITGPPGKLQSGKRLDESDYGLIPRSFHNLLEVIRDGEKKGISYTIRASYLELYNEQILDLLNVNGGKKLNMRWSPNKGFYIENLFTIECENFDDLMAVLEEGLNNRSTSAHNLNEFSSRSHSMLILNVDSVMQDPNDDNLYLTKHGKLTFVDLAGSEKVKDTNTSGDQLLETNNINKSLLVLGKCISALGDPKRKNGHIPYRDSKLTKLLADSIGGNGVTLMIACVSPSRSNLGETTNTLRYATRAKKIKNKPVVKMDPRERLILTLKKEVKVLRAENQLLREQLHFPPDPNKPASNKKSQNTAADEDASLNGESQDALSLEQHTDLYEMLQEYMIENEALRTENADMIQGFDKVWREQQSLVRENDRLQRKIEDLQRYILTAPVNTNYSQHSSRQNSWTDPHSELSSVDSGSSMRSYRSVPDMYMGNTAQFSSPLIFSQPNSPVVYKHPSHNSPTLPPVQHKTPPPDMHKNMRSSFHSMKSKPPQHHRPSPPQNQLSQLHNGSLNTYAQRFEVSKSLGARNAFQHSPANGRLTNKQNSGSSLIPMKALPSPPPPNSTHYSTNGGGMQYAAPIQPQYKGMTTPKPSSQFDLNEKLKQELLVLDGEIKNTQSSLTGIRST